MRSIHASRHRAALAAGLGGLLALAATGAGAATYFVDQGHRHASDANPGTEERPFKTMQRGVDAAAAGDTVFVKAGVYREGVAIKKSGGYQSRKRQPFWPGAPLPERINVSAFGDEKVVIDGADPVERKLWEPVADRAGVFAAAVETQPLELLGGRSAFPISQAFWNGKRLAVCLKRGAQGLAPAVPEPADANTWFYDMAAKRLCVNLGGADPRKEGLVEASVRWYGLCVADQQFVNVSGFTIRRASRWGIEAGRSVGITLSDCHVHDCESGIHMGVSRDGVVRRCVIHDVSGVGLDVGVHHAGLFYDNVVYSFFQDWRQVRSVYRSAAYLCFGGEFCRFYHNVALQPEAHPNPDRGAGFWPDVHGPGHFFAGNAVFRCGSGFYIESPMFGNVVQWNTVTRCQNGIWLAHNAANMVAENLCVENNLGLCLAGADTPVPDVAHNTFSHNWLLRNSTGIFAQAARGQKSQTRNYAQRNVYEIPDKGRAANWAGALYNTVEEFRQATGQESFARQEPIDLRELGLAWVRVDGLDSSRHSIPMFGNPDCQRQTSMTSFDPWFWRRGDADGTDSYPDDWNASIIPGENPYRALGNSFSTRFNNFGAVTLWAGLAAVAGTPVEGWFLLAGSLPKYAFTPRGMGWWSPSLPVAGGASVDVSLWMKTEDIQPTQPDGGAVVYVEWSDWNGQRKRRGYLVGGNGGGPAARPEFNRGSHAWGEVKGTVTAPADARRMALFMGGRGCTGRVSFDEIRTLAARTDLSVVRAIPARPGPVAAPAVVPLVDPQRLKFFEVDLSRVVNRALADDQADDGVGGWSDQGPGYDMRGLPPGRKLYDGVPFTILAPRSCVVLQSKYRPQSKLPSRVRIPVGRKADVLYFLHSGAWITPNQTHWSYIVRYRSGRTRTIPVVEGVNVRDWGHANITEFADTPTMRTVVAPEKAANTLSPTCGVYRTEWLNPHPGYTIREIEMVSEKQGVPILLAITGGVRK